MRGYGTLFFISDAEVKQLCSLLCPITHWPQQVAMQFEVEWIKVKVTRLCKAHTVQFLCQKFKGQGNQATQSSETHWLKEKVAWRSNLLDLR